MLPDRFPLFGEKALTEMPWHTSPARKSQEPHPSSARAISETRRAQQRAEHMLRRLKKMRDTQAPHTSHTHAGRCAPHGCEASGGRELALSRISADVSTHSSTEKGTMSNEPITTLFGMPFVLHGEGIPDYKVPGRSSEAPLDVEAVIEMLREIDAGSDHLSVAQKRTTQQPTTEEIKTRQKEVVASFAPPQTYAGWLQEKEVFTGDSIRLGKAKTNAERRLEYERKEQKHRKKLEKKLALERAAESAKMKFGASTKEKIVHRKRVKLNDAATVAQERERAIRYIQNQTPRNLLVCLLVIGVELFLFLSVYITREGNTRVFARPAAPESVSLLALVGAVGGSISFLSLFTLYSTILVR